MLFGILEINMLAITYKREPIMDLPKLGSGLLEHLGMILFGGFAGVLGWQRFKRLFRVEQKHTKEEETQIDVISLLRAEVDRLSEQNKMLYSAVHDLQREIMELRKENHQLRATCSVHQHAED